MTMTPKTDLLAGPYVEPRTTLSAPTLPPVTVTVYSSDEGTFALMWHSEAPMPAHVITLLDSVTDCGEYGNLPVALFAVAMLAQCAWSDYTVMPAEMWDVIGADAIGKALTKRPLTDTETLDAIHKVLDGQDCGSEELGEVLNLVILSGRPIRDPE